MRKKKSTNRDKEIEELVSKRLSNQFSLTEIMALRMVRAGTDRTNFKILKMVSSNINTVSKEFGLSRVPVNVRVTELESVGLVERFRGTGNFVLTDFGRFFIDEIESYKKLVREHVLTILDKHFE